MSAPALAILLFFFAHILAAYGGYVGVLRPGADPSLLPAEAIQFSIPSRSGQPLNGFILESDTYDSGVDLTKLAHVEADREVRLNSPIASRTLWERQAPINSTSWALDRLDGTMDGLFVYPPSAGNKVTVYVLDSGVNVSLPEFGGRVEEGPNFTNETTPGAEDEGHGTFVAALVGGKTYGVAKEVKMVSVKVIESAGVGRVSDIVRGLIHVVNATNNGTSGPTIIALSVGTAQSRVLDQALNYIVDLGIPIVGSSGNEGEDACNWSPGSALAVLTAAATNETGDLAAYYSNYGPCVKIWAPGSDVPSLLTNGTAAIKSGTSFASPLVSGTLALYWTQLLLENPNATGQDAMNVLGGNATASVKGLGFFSRTTNLFVKVPAV